METIHLKTVDPISQELLCSAAQRGIDLSWERYEKLQPQDGFLRLGLSCPFGCMQGPCRIDPFGRGAQKGVCGLGRDQMVAGMLLRLCLQGAMGAVTTSDGFPEVRFSGSLGTLVSSTLVKNEQPDITTGDIFKGNAMLGRTSSTYQELIVQSLRLSLLTLVFLDQANEKRSSVPSKFLAGYGAVAEHSVRIGFSGMPSIELVQALEQERGKDQMESVALVSLGEWIALEDRFMPIACTSGESELVVSSGAIHLLVAGSQTDPGLVDLCRQMNIPVVSDADIAEPSTVVQRAREVYLTLSQANPFAGASQAGVGHVAMSNAAVMQMIGDSSQEKVAIIGGSDGPQMSLGQLPAEIVTALRHKNVQVAGWGDAALWMIKNPSILADQDTVPLILENHQGPLMAIKALADSGQLGRVQGICFTGLKSCRELSIALGLAYLGCRVSVAAPIPIQGSQAVKDTIAELLQASGGELDHYDRLAQTKEIVEWFTNP